MNGWQRLGVVLATLIAVPAGGLAYLISDEDHSKQIHWFKPTLVIETSDKSDEGNLRRVLEEGARSLRLEGRCRDNRAVITPPAPGMPTYMIVCEKPIDWSIVWLSILAPFGIVFGAGYVFAWVAAGFRRPEA